MGRATAARLVTAALGVAVLVAGVVVAGALVARGAGDGRAAVAQTGPVAPAPSRAAVPARAPVRARVSAVRGLGDSVPAAAGCTCTSYVRELGDDLGRAQRSRVVVVNEAQGGQTSAGLLRQVQQRGTKAMAAQVTVVTIGANDLDSSVLSSASCSAPGLSCYQAALAGMGANVDAILTALTTGLQRHGPVLVTGYWNVFLDGEVGAARGAAYQRDSDALTRATNAVLSRQSRRHGVTYVDLYTPFKQASGGDDTPMLAPDGDHPSALGHRLIAAVLRRALR